MADFMNPDQAADFIIAERKSRQPATPKTSNQDDLRSYIANASVELGLDPDITGRMFSTESGFNQGAVSPKGAFGVAQLMPETAKDLSQKYRLDPTQERDNAKLGLLYLKENLDRFNGSYPLAVAAYHAGPGAVAKAGGIPNTNDGIMDTAAYVRRIVGGQGVQAQAQEPQAQPFKFHSPDEFVTPVAQDKSSSAGFADHVAQGFQRGKEQSKGLAGGAVALLGKTADSVFGDSEISKSVQVWGENLYKEKMADSAKLSDSASFTDVLAGKADIGPWIGDALGYLGYQAAESLVTGGAGALIGKTIGKGAVAATLKPAIAREIARISATDAGKAMGAEAIAQVALKNVTAQAGAAASVFANNLRQEAGSINGEATEGGHGDDLVRIWLASLAAAGVDTAAEAVFAKKVLGQGEGYTGNYLKRLGKEAGSGMLVQGGTEGVQTGIERWGAQQDLTGADAARDYLDSIAVGALGGSAGAPAAALHAKPAAIPAADGVSDTIAKPTPFEPVQPQSAPKLEHSPLTNAAAAANTPDPLTQRLGGVEAWLNDANNIRAMRAAQGFGPESVSEVLSAYSIAKNPTLDPMTREKALTGLEQNLSHFANRPDWVFSAATEAPSEPGTALAPIGGTAVGPVNAAPDTNTLNGQAREIVDAPALARPAIASNEPSAVGLPQRSALRIGGISRAIANGAQIVGDELRAKDGRVLFRNLVAEEIAPFARQLAAQSNVSQEAQAAPAFGFSGSSPEIGASNQETQAPEQAPNISGFDAQIPEAAPNISPEASNIPATAAEPGPLEEGKTPDDWFKPVVPSGMFFADWVKAQGKAIPQAGSEEWQKARAAFKAYQAGEQAAPAIDPAVAQQAAEQRAEMTAAANEAATSPLNDKPEPTEAQKLVGNYPKGHIRLHGFDITIEQPKGSVRRGTDEDGNEWATEMAADYGYIKRTEGADGEHVDVFVGEHPLNDTVYVIDQRQPDGTGFDEHKCVMAAANRSDAERIYRQSYTPDWKGFGGIVQMTHDEFKDWLDRGDLSRPAAEWVAKEDQAAYRPTDTEEVWTSAEKTRTGLKFVGNPKAIYDYLIDLIGKGIVRREFGASVATKDPAYVLSLLPKRFELYTLKDQPEGRQRVKAAIYDDGSVRLYGQDNGFIGPKFGSVRAAIAEYAGQVEQKAEGATTPSEQGVDTQQGNDVAAPVEQGDNAQESQSVAGTDEQPGAEPARIAASEVPRPDRQQESVAQTESPKLDDFGKKLEGAAKDRMRAYLDRLGEAKDLDVMEHPLSVSFPEPDYKALIADGVDPFVVGWVRASRDEIPQKPRKAWRLKGWAAEVTLLRDVASKLLDGSISKEAMLEKLAGASDALRDQVGGRAELYQAVGHDVSLKDLKLEHITESFENGVRVSVENGTDYWDVRGVPERTAFSYWPKSYGKGKTREAAIADFASRYDSFAKKDADSAKPKQKFTIYRYKSQPGEWIIGKKVGKRYIDLKSFDSAVEARNFLESGQKELQEQFDKITSIPSERGEENAPRIGGDHRSGADVTAEQFQETFGFRGGQFGASMPANERQENLNRTYDALMDLAGVLGVEPKALSLNGELGIAFGARGRGGKNAPAAHYEPDANGKVGDSNVVINLTRRNGPGALAHEWFHALDNYLARSRNEVAGFLTGKPYERGDGVRPELVSAFRGVMDAIASTGVPKRSGELDSVRTNDYWSSKEEMAARSFEAYIVKKLADLGGTNDYLANIVSKEYWDALEAMRTLAFLNSDAKQAETYPYPMAEEMPKIEAAFDNLFNTIETKETDKGVAIYSLADGDPLPESQWLSAGHISELAQKLVEKFATDIPIRIVDKTDDAFRLAGVEGNDDFGAASGITLDGRIYLVREGLSDEGAVGRTLFHELLHFGLRRFLTEGQYIAEMGKLRARDTAIKTYAAAWAEGPEGQALAAQGKDQRYIIARGTDEALASLAEKVGTLETGYNKNGVVARAIRAVTNWLAALAERFGFNDAAASLRGVANQEAMDYIRGVFGKLERGDAPGTFSTRWGYSDPAFKIAGESKDGASDEEVGSKRDRALGNPGTGFGSEGGVLRRTTSNSASVDDGGTAFSLRNTPILKNSQVTQLFSWLAKFDEAFKQPTSHKKDIASIAGEIDNGIKVRKWGSEFGDEFNDGRQPDVWELTGPNSKERSSYIFDDGKHVWVDVQFLLPGVDDGSKIYGIAAAYAHNNGKVLIGDPAGLSPTAFFRRTENMISSALKFGTTKHLQPHPAQVDPKAYYGQPGQHPDFANAVDGLGLDWRAGDDEHNLRDMLLKSYHAAKRFTPDIEHIVYDFDRREFVDTRTGEGSGGVDGGYSSRPVDGGVREGHAGEGLQRADSSRRGDGEVESSTIGAGKSGEGESPSQGDRSGDRLGPDGRIGQFFARIPVTPGSRYSGGSATKARAALVNTLVRSQSGEGRANILAALVRQLSGQGLDPELQRTLYSLRTNPTTPGRITREDALAATAFIRDLTRIPVHVVESPSQAPREIQQSIRKQGATFKHVEGAFHRGEIWLFSDNLTSIERAREVLLHEGAHYGLRGMFGDRLDPMMLEIEDKNPSIREQVDRFLEMAPAPMPRVRAIEEVLVEMAAQGEATKLKGWPRFYAFIRNILRQMGFVKGWSQEDVQRLLGQAHEFWKSGSRPLFSHAMGGTALSQQESANDDGSPDDDGPGGGVALSAGTARDVVRDRFNSQDNRSRIENTKEFMNYLQGKMESALKGSDRFGWLDKSIHTQLHKALKNKYFGTVYHALKRFVNDASRAAMRPAELAPTILPRIDVLSSIKPAIMALIKGKSASADINAAFAAVLRGTLDKEVFGDAQSAKLTPGQFKIYTEYRASIDASMGELSAAEAYQVVRKLVPEVKEDVIDSPDKARSIITTALREKFENKFAELQEAMPEIQTLDDARTLLKSDVVGYTPLTNEYATDLAKTIIALNETQAKIDEIFDRLDQLKSEGYAPLSRFGTKYVDVYRVDALGNRLRDEDKKAKSEYFGLFESEFERDQMAKRLREEYANDPSIKVDVGTTSEEEWKQFKGVDPASIELFASRLGLDHDDVFQEWIRSATSNRSTLKRMLHRKGTAGFSEDGARVLASFLTSNGRRAAQLYHNADIKAALDAFPDNQGAERDDASLLNDYVQNPDEEATGIRSLLFMHMLGGSVSNFLINLTQPGMVTLPYLAQFVGAAKASKMLIEAYKLVYKPEAMPEALREALKKSDQQGVVGSPEIQHLIQASSRPLIGKVAGKNAAYRWNGFMQLWGMPFAFSESINRKAAFISGWMVAKEQGLSDHEAFEAGSQCADQTQFVVGKHARPNWSRGTIGSLAFTFKTFAISYVELLVRMMRTGPQGRRAALYGLGLLFLASGLQGLPGSDDLDDLIDTIAQMLGYNVSSKAAKRKWLENLAGREVASVMLYGLSSLTPFDLQSRMGLGNLAPATAVFMPSNQNKGSSALELMGPAASLAKSYMDTADAIGSGDWHKAGTAWMPKAIRDFTQGAIMAATGEYHDTKGRKVAEVTLLDAALKAIGFQPQVIASESRAISSIQGRIDYMKKVQSVMTERWAEAIADRDSQGVADVLRAIKVWNEDNPDTPVAVKRSAVQRRVHDMQTSRKERFVKSVPPSIRAGVAEGID